jgi:polyketide synthase PksN
MTRRDLAATNDGQVLLALSAKTAQALQAGKERLAKVLLGEPQRWDQQGLRAMSYTLLTGRQKFMCRWAAVVGDREEALQVLQAGIGPEKRSNVFQAEVRREFKPQRALQSFGQSLIERVAQGLDNREKREALGAVADLYCQGYAIEWRRLFEPNVPQRIHLPPYQFARESYWAPQRASGAKSLLSNGQGGEIEPSADDAPALDIESAIRKREPGRDLSSETAKDTADEELTALVERALSGLISVHLKIPQEALDHDTPLNEFGFDSITLGSFAQVLNQRYGLELKPTIFFAAPTIEALAVYLVREHRKEFEGISVGTSQRSSAPLPSGALEQAEPASSVLVREIEATPRRIDRSSVDEPIAVIGLSGCFPKAPDMQTFWVNLQEGRDCIGELPPSRWGNYFSPTVLRAGVMEGI